MSTTNKPPSDTELRAMVREALQDALNQREPRRTQRVATSPSLSRAVRKPLPPPLCRTAVDALKRATPSRIVQGRTGTRYLTDTYIGLRADHAIALDAVHSELPEDFASAQGWLSLTSQAQEHDEYLLHPDLGRRLSEASRQRLRQEGTVGADVQIVAGDGLSAYALTQNGPALVQALEHALQAAGFKLGRTVCVRFARVGIQDDIGVTLNAKCTAIIVGERPGLGTGDSLSIYTAYGPKLGQDNSEKDCISNVRGLGLSSDEAARRCAELLKATFVNGGGGVKLV